MKEKAYISMINISKWKLFGVFVLFCVSIGCVFGQGQNIVNSEFLPKVTVSSPEASGLGRYGDFNVSEYTGSANISIPIYNIQVGSFTYPISLNYSTSGVKVDEIHSWVGCNWSLSGVGVITRTIAGLPDERGGSGLLSRNLMGNYLKPSYNINNLDDAGELSLITDNLIDSEPDIFFFNFGNYNGKFFFDKQGEFTCIPANTLKLIKSPILNGNVNDQEWHIRDMNGNDYYFAQAGNGIETTTTETSSNVSSEITSWYLTKININNSNQEITIGYTNKVENYTLPAVQSVRYVVYRKPAALSENASSIFNEGSLLYNGSTSGGNMTDMFFGGVCRIQSINFPNGTIDFIANIPRLGMANGSRMLNRVVVKNLANQIIEDFELQYLISKGRYYLVEVKKRGQGSLQEASYKMDYLSPESLPNPSYGSIIATSQDHWGYFNGQNNQSLLPAINNFPLAYSQFTGNREPSENHMKYGSIHKLTYPTGGYTEYEFEAHKYDPNQNPVIEAPPNALIPISITGTVTQTVENDVKNFSVSSFQNNASIQIMFSDYQRTLSEEEGWNIDVLLKRLEGGVFVNKYHFTAWQLFDINNATSPGGNGLFDFNVNLPVSLVEGQYQLVVNRVCINNCSPIPIYPKCSANVAYLDLSALPSLAGGLRIREIKNYNFDNRLTSRRVFKYSLGKLLSYPKYLHNYGQFIRNAFVVDDAPSNYCFHFPVYFRELSSSSQTILGYTNGSAVGYETVSIFDIGEGDVDNGYILKEFAFVNDEINQNVLDFSYWNNYGSFLILNPSFPSNSMDFKRGNLLRELVYRKNDDFGYEIQKLTKLTYDFGESDLNGRFRFIEGYRVKRIFNHRDQRVCMVNHNGFDYPSPQVGFTPPFSALFTYTKYKLISSWPRLIKKEILEYQNSSILYSDENYQYNDPVHLQPTQILTRNSKGEDFRRNFTYTNSYHDLNIRNQLISRNMIGEIVNEDVAIRKGTVFSPLVRQRKLFESYNNGIHLLPSKFFIDYQDVNTNSAEYEILSVLPSGKPFEVRKVDGIREIYLWSYNSQHLMVKIYGVTSQQLNSFLGYDLMAVISGLTPSQIVSIGESIRGMPNANVESYDYIPLIGLKWQKDIRGRTTYYEYDLFNRLMHTKDNDGNILKKFCYNYAGQPINCFDQVFTNNQAASANFTRNNCPAGFTGSIVTYTIGANTVNSYISVADANAIATQRVQNEGQAYANSNGVCNPISTCNWSNCNNSGPMFTCINGFCEEGVQIHTGEVYMNWQYYCRYHYEWSDGSRSIDYYTPSFGFGCLQSNF